MTTYILSGSGDRRYPEYLMQLARVIHVEIEQPKILSCWFSNPEDDVHAKFLIYKEHFLKYFNAGTTFTYAERETFLEQVAAADVIYFHGGRTSLLFAAMKEYGDMNEAFRSKIVVGSSAGANYLSAVGFSPTTDTITHGSGLSGLNTVVHYGSQGFGGKTFKSGYWPAAFEHVQKETTGQGVQLLYEGTFVVVRI